MSLESLNVVLPRDAVWLSVVSIRFEYSVQARCCKSHARTENARNLLVIFFLFRLHGGLCDTCASLDIWFFTGTCNMKRLTIQITLSRLCDTATSLVLILLQNTNLLKSLHNLAVYASAGIDVVGRAGATVASGAVNLSETTNTDGLPEVDVTGDGSSADVEPVDGLGWEFFCWASLDGIDPT